MTFDETLVEMTDDGPDVERDDFIRATVVCKDLTDDPSGWDNARIADMERKSMEAWANIDEDRRRAMAVITRDILIRMLEDPCEWLPTSMLPKQGTKFGLFVYVSMDEVEQAVVMLREQAEREFADQITEIQEMKEKFSAKEHEDEADQPST